MYTKFCQTVFGQSIDHDLPASKSPEAEKAKRLERTKTLYKMEFNIEPNLEIWEENKTEVIDLTPKLAPNTRKRKHEEGTEQEQEFQIFVRYQQMGKTLTFKSKAVKTIKTIKEKIKRIEGIPLDLQMLVYAGGVLSDDKTLSDYNIEKESTLHLSVRGSFRAGSTGSWEPVNIEKTLKSKKFRKIPERSISIRNLKI